MSQRTRALKALEIARTKHDQERDAAEDAWAVRAAWWAWSCWSGHGTRVLPIYGKGGCKRRWSQDAWQETG
jgi:hypothetical protein